MTRRFSWIGLAIFLCLPLVPAQSHAERIYVANFNSDRVTVLDSTTYQVIASIPVGDQPQGIALNGDGSRAFCANRGSDTVSVIDTALNSVIATIAVGPEPQDVAFSSSQNRVYVTNNNSFTISVIDATTNTLTQTITLGSWPYGIAADASGARVYVAMLRLWTVHTIDTATNTVVANIGMRFPVSVAVSPSGNRAYASGNLNAVMPIDTLANTGLDLIKVGSNPSGLAVRPDGSRVYVANTDDNTISVIDSASNTVVSTVAVGRDPGGVACHPSGQTVFVANASDDIISVIDADSCSLIASIFAGDGPVDIAVGPNPSSPPSDDGGGGCFIATAAYGSPAAWQVDILRKFRDRILAKSGAGRFLVRLYYSCSPKIAAYLSESDGLRRAARIMLMPVVGASWIMMRPVFWLICMLIFVPLYVAIAISRSRTIKRAQNSRDGA